MFIDHKISSLLNRSLIIELFYIFLKSNYYVLIINKPFLIPYNYLFIQNFTHIKHFKGISYFACSFKNMLLFCNLCSIILYIITLRVHQILFYKVMCLKPFFLNFDEKRIFETKQYKTINKQKYQIKCFSFFRRLSYPRIFLRCGQN